MNKIVNKKERSRDQQTVVMEEMNSNVKLVLERFSGLDQKIDNNHQEFVEFKEETRENFSKLFEFRKETEANFSKLFEFRDEMLDFKKGTEANFKVSLEYLSRIDDEIQSIKAELEDLKPRLKEKADLEKLLDMEKRIIKMEKLVFAKSA